MTRLSLLLLLAACEPVSAPDFSDMTKVGGVVVREGGVVPEGFERAYFAASLTDESCNPYTRYLLPEGWCLEVTGCLGAISREDYDMSTCGSMFPLRHQMFSQSKPGVTEVFLSQCTLADGGYVLVPGQPPRHQAMFWAAPCPQPGTGTEG